MNDMRAETKVAFERVDARFDEAAAERRAIRQVIDTLASQEDFASLDRKISSVSADTQATQDVKAEVSRLRSDVKAAGLSVRYLTRLSKLIRQGAISRALRGKESLAARH
ncbi:MAG: hypothetical protein ACRBM6_25455 [Geminicoccales bacterium]